MHHRALLLCLSACGSIDNKQATLDASTVEADAALDTDAMIDAPEVPTGLGPWGAPTKIMELSDPTALDEDATVTADQRVIVFKSNRTGSMGAGDLWTSRRSSVSAAWPTPTLITELSSAFDDAHPWISADGLRIYFSSGRSGTNDIYTSVRANLTSPWSPPTPITEINTAASEWGLNLSADGLQGVLDTDRGGPRAPHLVSRTTGNGTFASISEIAEITGTAISAVLVDDGHAIYFQDGTDLWVGTRASATSPFGFFEKVLSVVGSLIQDPWVSEDQRTLIITLETAGTRDLYLVTR